MPFKSEKQRRWMWKNKPELAREWSHKYGRKAKRKHVTKRARRK